MRVVLILLGLLVLGAAAYWWWLRRSVPGREGQESTEAERLYQQGMAYRKGVGVDFDYPRARQLLRQAAETGHAGAQYDYGVMLREGLGGAKDEAEALSSIERAARGGDARARLEMGRRSLVGDGVEQSLQNAESWLNGAAESGNVEAQVLLANLYRDRASPLWHSIKAAALMTKAADQRHPAAAYALSEMYEKGEGVERNVKLADEWLRKAAGYGVPEAEFKLAKFYLTGAFGHSFPQDYRAALDWFRRAAAHGIGEAEYEVGLRYERNEGVDAPDMVLAVTSFLKAAELGYAPAQYRMGQMFLYGDTVEKDPVKSRHWFAAAAAQGFGDASEQVKKLRAREIVKPVIAQEPDLPSDIGRNEGADWKG
jgi:TPR repeat protein